MRSRSLALLSTAAQMVFFLSACDGSADEVTSVHAHRSNSDIVAQVEGAVASDVASVRELLAPLHLLTAANAAGFDAPVSPCVASPDGGMGFHWANVSRIDATVQWDEPEILVFVPSADSKDGVKLGAVEYVVPIALSAVAPVLFGQTFVPGGPGNSLWTLHVWTGVHNPSGLFAPWNPNVACPV